MINSPVAALATGLIASQRLDNVPNAEPFRNNFFVSSLLCGNAAAQLVFNMRTADDLAEVLKDRANLQGRLAAQRFAIISGPVIEGKPAIGAKLKAVAGRYEGVAPPTEKNRRWLIGDKKYDGNEFTVTDEHVGKTLTLHEEIDTPVGRVTVASAPMSITSG